MELQTTVRTQMVHARVMRDYLVYVPLMMEIILLRLLLILLHNNNLNIFNNKDQQYITGQSPFLKITTMCNNHMT